MPKKVVIGKQDYASLIENNYFYVDKTDFIRQWWDAGDDVTLITRPRRFGKTLNMSMLNCFFSNKYAGRGDLFDGLDIWKYEEYRKIQGTYPVIFMSFADVKQSDYSSAVSKIKRIICTVYQEYADILRQDIYTDAERMQFDRVTQDMDDVTAQSSIQDLCRYLGRYYGKKVIVILDEYDTPMQEAYVYGYWNEFTGFLRSFFNSTFKTNPNLERAVMTGITRVSKESMFSDLNNLNVITTTSEEYAQYFGFTEKEVFASLDAFGLSDKKDDVKKWYDGFTFGSQRDIYNPWSITNYLDKRRFASYWASTSANSLVNSLIQRASADIKKLMEELINGESIVVSFDEQIVFNQLDTDENALWSLLVAGGYLKVDNVDYRGILRKPWYRLTITNLETMGMFSDMFSGWFNGCDSHYNKFVEAMLNGSLKEMNLYINDVALTTFSSFDTGTHPSGRSQPERFYHGFVLGLIADLRDIYEIKSNRESGYGRYDVMLIPLENDKSYNAIVMEFKVREAYDEKELTATADAALRQIDERNYDAELIRRGISKERIKHYGFAFEGKRVLIAERTE